MVFVGPCFLWFSTASDVLVRLLGNVFLGMGHTFVNILLKSRELSPSPIDGIVLNDWSCWRHFRRLMRASVFWILKTRKYMLWLFVFFVYLAFAGCCPVQLSLQCKMHGEKNIPLKNACGMFAIAVIVLNCACHTYVRTFPTYWGYHLLPDVKEPRTLTPAGYHFLSSSSSAPSLNWGQTASRWM